MFVLKSTFNALKKKAEKVLEDLKQAQADRDYFKNEMQVYRAKNIELQKEKELIALEEEKAKKCLFDRNKQIEELRERVSKITEQRDSFKDGNHKMALKIADMRVMYENNTRPVNPETSRMMSWTNFIKEFGSIEQANDIKAAGDETSDH